jgi:hypothetical protein
MATVFFQGTVDEVAQLDTCTVGGTIGTETFEIKIGGVVIASYTSPGSETAADVVDALVPLFNASSHPYVDQIIEASDGGNDVILTAVGGGIGMPFTTTTTATGSATFVTVNTTANAGPYDMACLGNYSGGALPSANDELWIMSPVFWNLDSVTNVLDVLYIPAIGDHWVGLCQRFFTASSDGRTWRTSVVEYRGHYLELEAIRVEIGNDFGSTTPVGSGRIKLDNQYTTAASKCIVYTTGNSSIDSAEGLPAVRYLVTHATAELHIQDAPGGVGVGVEEPTETATIYKIKIGEKASAETQLFVGEGVTWTYWEQWAGDNYARAVGPVTQIDVWGGTLETEGYYSSGDIIVHSGGTYYPNQTAATTCIVKLTIKSGGIVDATKDTEARSWAEVVMEKGATCRYNEDHTIIGTLTLPDGNFSLQCN